MKRPEQEPVAGEQPVVSQQEVGEIVDKFCGDVPHALTKDDLVYAKTEDRVKLADAFYQRGELFAFDSETGEPVQLYGWEKRRAQEIMQRLSQRGSQGQGNGRSNRRASNEFLGYHTPNGSESEFPLIKVAKGTGILRRSWCPTGTAGHWELMEDIIPFAGGTPVAIVNAWYKAKAESIKNGQQKGMASRANTMQSMLQGNISITAP